MPSPHPAQLSAEPTSKSILLGTLKGQEIYIAEGQDLDLYTCKRIADELCPEGTSPQSIYRRAKHFRPVARIGRQKFFTREVAIQIAEAKPYSRREEDRG